MKGIFSKYKWQIYLSSVILFVILLMLPISTRVRLEPGHYYYTTDEVALYIFEYHELPDNFITKNEANTDFAAGINSSHVTAMKYMLNIGGDVFDYRGSITSMTDITDLRECDIYLDRESLIEQNNRGTYRLVFSADGEEVYYSENHYGSFTEITEGQIQATSTFFWVLFSLYTGGLCVFYFFAFKYKIITGKEVAEDSKKIGIGIIKILIIPFIVVYSLIKTGIETIANHRKTITEGNNTI